MDEALVQVERRERVLLLGLNRPQQLNALNEPLRVALTKSLDEAAVDDAVNAVVLYGCGERAFAAGADVAEFAYRSVDEQAAVYAQRRVYEAVAEFPKPILAALHGHCYGGAAEVALACDMRIADPSLRFGQFEIRLGLMPSAGGTQRLARLVGIGQAFRLTTTGESIDAGEAHRIGVVELLAAQGAHVTLACEIAAQISRWSVPAVRRIKVALRASQNLSLEAGIALEKRLFLQGFSSPDAREGVAAFLARRDPRFTDT